MADNPRIEDLRRRVQQDPASIAFAQLAEEYRRAGQYRESVEACRAGLVLHPGYLSARVTLGRALIELGRLDEAQHEMELVLKTAPENLAAIRGIADVLYKRGSFGEALEFYRAALAIARNDPELEQTVNDLARRVTPTKRPEPKDGLSLDQMQQEMAARVPAPTPSPPTSQTQRIPAAAPPLALRMSSDTGRFQRPREGETSRFLRARQEAGEAGPKDPHYVQDPQYVERALRAVAALEQWLEAIHVARANRAS